MEVDALLCDAATVRENLLHVLGAGVTRIARSSFPASLHLKLALMITMHPSEADEPHKLRVAIREQDGLELGQLTADFSVSRRGSEAEVGESVALPLVFNLDPVEVPREGTYGIDCLIDGQLRRSFMFVARLRDKD